MLDKLFQNKSERWSLLGSFLIILGIFLPWYYISAAYEIPWAGVQLEGLVYGYSLTFGKLFLLITALFTSLTLVPQKEANKSEIFCGQLFTGSLIVILFITNVLSPIFRVPGPSPNIGILIVLAGCVFLAYGLKKGYESL